MDISTSSQGSLGDGLLLFSDCPKIPVLSREAPRREGKDEEAVEHMFHEKMGCWVSCGPIVFRNL